MAYHIYIYEYIIYIFCYQFLLFVAVCSVPQGASLKADKGGAYSDQSITVADALLSHHGNVYQLSG